MIALSIDQIVKNQKSVDKAVKKSKRAQKAIKKANRKMRKALRAQNLQEIETLLGMAQEAIKKAKTIARYGV